MEAEFVEIVRKLVSERGKDDLFDTKLCRAALADLTRNKYKRERNLLLQAVESGAAKAIDDANGSDLQICKIRQIRKLQDDYASEQSAAEEVVNMLALILRGDSNATVIKPIQKLANTMPYNPSKTSQQTLVLDNSTPDPPQPPKGQIWKVLVGALTIIAAIFILYSLIVTKKADEQPELPTITVPEKTEHIVSETTVKTAHPAATEWPYGIEMIHVLGGSFMMGCTPEQSDCSDNEYPEHEVTLSDFYIGKYPVTQGQWKAVMGENPSILKGDDLPVENVSWNQAQEFIKKLNQNTGKNYRLPTEAEWEYAARGGSQSRGYKYSGGNDIGEVAWYEGNSGDKTHPVGTKKANELGIYDMNGNVFEWVNDRYESYNVSWNSNPEGAASGSSRVLRGGCYGIIAKVMRISYRISFNPGMRLGILGFRLALSSK